jgi:hypothetical protein
LPDTKAALYKQFVEAIYLWKDKEFSTTPDQRKLLNEQLGQLALQAIDRKDSRFRLLESFVRDLLGEPDEEGSLFCLALRLGWLNKVGVAAENPGERGHCAQNMPYPDFYRAWRGNDNIPIGDSSIAQTLEKQFTSIAEQLQPTAKTYPIVINAQALEGETDTSAIAQELCNQIHLTAFPDELEIPEVSNAPQLKRLIPQIKKQVQKQNLALILDKCEQNQEQVTFCRKLSDVLHIAWITNQPLEPPLRGFLPNQPNLLSAIQSWIDEID